MSLEDYIREQEAKAEQNMQPTGSRLGKPEESTRDPAEAGHNRGGI